jgi:hypothetical protein
MEVPEIKIGSDKSKREGDHFRSLADCADTICFSAGIAM